MPAESKKQQRFFGMVHAVQKGELSPNEVGPAVRKAARNTDYSDAKDIASTKHKTLPEKKGSLQMKYFDKISAYTEHGKTREVAKAKLYSGFSEAAATAGKESPGLDYLKGTYMDPMIYKLLARKQAYKSQLKGIENVKGHIPFVGMGPAGEKALKKITK
jgi:hypothetical protein